MVLNFEGRVLYLDLDGSFADFDFHFRKLFGVSPQEVKKIDKWRMIKETENFFLMLPPIPGAIEFYNRIRHYPHCVLTGCPAEDYDISATQKRKWSRLNLCKNIMVLPVKGSLTKPMFMHNPGDVIFDDRPEVCEAWEKAGGIAIHFTGDYDHAYERIRDIFGY